MERLNTIAERFSKIGSVPELLKQDIVGATQNSFNYLKSRSSKQVKFNFKCTNSSIYSKINLQLYNWVIENLVKSEAFNALAEQRARVFTKLNMIISQSM